MTTTSDFTHPALTISPHAITFLHRHQQKQVKLLLAAILHGSPADLEASAHLNLEAINALINAGRRLHIEQSKKRQQ